MLENDKHYSDTFTLKNFNSIAQEVAHCLRTCTTNFKIEVFFIVWKKTFMKFVVLGIFVFQHVISDFNDN